MLVQRGVAGMLATLLSVDARVAFINGIAISSSSSIIVQSSAVHRSAVARKSAHSAAPNLRSNATTSRLFVNRMAHLRGVLPSLQRGG
jgi:hypothetical protein